MTDPPTPPILSAFQAGPLLAAHRQGLAETSTSLDLGRTQTSVHLLPDGIALPDGQRLAWEHVQAINNHETGCFRIEDNTPAQLQAYSPRFNRYYSLMPTSGAPTVLIAGFPMHRIKDTDPMRDTQAKIKAAAPCRGNILDTTTGLGYTAILAARTADHVTTIELDPTTLEIARQNPWSRELFTAPNIAQRIGNAADLLPTLESGHYSRVIHDPPTFKLAGELYSEAFYRELWRVLRPGGRVFHYIGNLASSSGHGVLRGVTRRLKAAGFERLVRQPQAFGVVAYKG